MGIAKDFYKEALQILTENHFRFLVGGAFALKYHTGITRDTKDLDIFCTSGEYPKILKAMAKHGYKTEVTDARWIAKASKEEHFIDFIFNTVNNICNVDETWFENSIRGELLDSTVNFVSAEDLFWCKIYVQNRDHYDGADLNHLILKKGHEMNWNKIMTKMEQHWHLLLAQFLNFQFIYPSERDLVPKWLFNELIERANEQYELPVSIEKICRGPLIEHSEYNPDIINWNYKIITVNKL